MTNGFILLRPYYWTTRKLKELYDWVMHWADTPYGTPALGILAFAESSFFPVPPDVLLMALSFAKPKRSLFYAFVCSICSVSGGMLGYLIGMELFDLIGKPILSFYGAMKEYDYVRDLYNKNAFWSVFTAGFTPIPYKVFTIAGGACLINFPVFVLASAISRSARFFLVAGLIRLFGEKIKVYIEKYFDILSLVFVALLIGGFIVVKMVMK
jgi:membrane protein YqaA with SNARE-associated domain